MISLISLILLLFNLAWLSEAVVPSAVQLRTTSALNKVWGWDCDVIWTEDNRIIRSPNFCALSGQIKHTTPIETGRKFLCYCECGPERTGELCQFILPYNWWTCSSLISVNPETFGVLNHCINGGIMQSDGSSCYCNCPSGWTGPDCGISWKSANPKEIGTLRYQCDISPYTNKATLNPCYPLGTSEFLPIRSLGNNVCECRCKSGFDGRRCSISYDTRTNQLLGNCLSSSCIAGADSCVNGIYQQSGPGKWCICKDGWTGAVCNRPWNDFVIGYEILQVQPTGTKWNCAIGPFGTGTISPNHCNPNGIYGIDGNTETNKCSCECRPGRTGALCNTVTCIDPLVSGGQSCTKHGVCTSSGCTCSADNDNVWYGGYCSSRSPCNINGTSKATCAALAYYPGTNNEYCESGLTCECKSNSLYGSPYCCPISQSDKKICHGNQCIQTDKGSVCECIKTPKGACNGFTCNEDGTCDCFNKRSLSCRTNGDLAADGQKAYLDCSVDNSFGDFPVNIRNVPLWYGESCCPTAYHSDNPKRRSLCGGRGTCSISTGTCSCNIGLAGTYCCPAIGGIACGGFGTCNEHGRCDCTSPHINGVLGACEINVACPTKSPLEECTGRGTCQQYPERLWPEISIDLNWDPRPPFNVPIQARGIATQGLYEYIRWIFYIFINIDISLPQYLLSENYWLASHIDWNALYRIADQSQITAMRSSSATASGNMVLCQAMFNRAFPERTAGPDIAWLTKFVAGITSSDRNTRIIAIEELLTYEINPDYQSTGYRCRCGSPGASGLDCSLSCPIGLDNQVCSGFFNGRSRGLCDSITNTCICSKGYAGIACQISIVGTCIANTDVGTTICSDHGSCLGNDTSRSCQCANGWTGPFCQYSTCSIGSLSTIECSNHGSCDGITKKCTCNKQTALSSSTSPSIVPLLPIGTLCNETAQLECIAYRPTSSSGLNHAWMECNGHGTCTSRSNLGLPPICICDPLYSGTQCDIVSCGTSCNVRQTCNNQGQCVCKPLYMPPSSCADDSTVPSLCVNGVPDINGTICTCNEGFKKDSKGYCTIAVCPYVMDTNQGVSECDLSINPICSPPTVTTNCCYDACGSSCRYNGTNFNCNCANTIAFTHIDGICYPKCHGKNNYNIIGSSLRCDCSSIIKTTNQYTDLTCQLFTCLNGGIGISSTLTTPGRCICIPPYHGSFCGNVGCGISGTFNEDTNKCDCIFPFKHSSLTDPFCNATDCVHGTPIPGACICDSGWGENLCDKPLFSSSTGFPLSSSSSAIYYSSSLSSTTFNPSSTFQSTGQFINSSSSSSSVIQSSSSSSTGLSRPSSAATIICHKVLIIPMVLLLISMMTIANSVAL